MRKKIFAIVLASVQLLGAVGLIVYSLTVRSYMSEHGNVYLMCVDGYCYSGGRLTIELTHSTDRYFDLPKYVYVVESDNGYCLSSNSYDAVDRIRCNDSYYRNRMIECSLITDKVDMKIFGGYYEDDSDYIAADVSSNGMFFNYYTNLYQDIKAEVYIYKDKLTVTDFLIDGKSYKEYFE